MMRWLTFLFLLTILFCDCDDKKEENNFFLDYLKESKLIENTYHNKENIHDSLQYTQVKYFNDSILTQSFRHGYILCELYEMNASFHDTTYYLGIVYPPVLPHSGYIILFDEDGKYLDQKEVAGKYHLDIYLEPINGHSKTFIIVNYGDGGAGTFHDIININAVIDHKITSLYQYDQKYESWYDNSKIRKDSVTTFAYQPRLHQIMKINEVTKGYESNSNFNITEQYQDTTIIHLDILKIN